MSARSKNPVSNVKDTPRSNRLAMPPTSHRTGARSVSTVEASDVGSTATWKKSTALKPPSRVPGTLQQGKPTVASALRAASIQNKANPETPSKAKAITVGRGDRRISNELGTTRNSKHTVRTKGGRADIKSVGDSGTPRKLNQNEDPLFEPLESEPNMREMDIQTNKVVTYHEPPRVDQLTVSAAARPKPEFTSARLEPKKPPKQCETMRKFSAHEKNEERRLDELREFSQRGYVTKRNVKKPSEAAHDINSSTNVFHIMDEIFKREVPRAESFSNIKERIQQKEMELMSMFGGHLDMNRKPESK